ncbi:hypothetical protein [Limnoglobus roseus]|nr:hypothetical protein [Limnoglobus roseus]
MYAAHKAAGGMTSVYRQIGFGCERLFKALVQDNFELTADQVHWSYTAEKKDGTIGTLTLDARIDLAHIGTKPEIRQRVRAWLDRCCQKLEMSAERTAQIKGVVFEVRQGYKSADAGRQNKDLQFGMNAEHQNYLPVLAVISTQVSHTVIRRYRNAKMLVLTGTQRGADVDSTYEFFRSVVGFDLANFFERNSEQMRKRCTSILGQLLTPA